MDRRHCYLDCRYRLSFVHKPDVYPAVLPLVLSGFSNVDEADWLLFNTYDKLEEQVVNWMAKQSQTRMITIGPTMPSFYLDKRLEDNAYGLHLFTPDSDTCTKWLDTKEATSVVYMSFGSLANLGEEQMEEIAWGIRNTNYNFIWVVRATEESKLPKNFVQETSGKGLVTGWCQQLEVLAHKAVGCFVTHCGWNSILEALSLGVPMVATPQWTDQPTNAKFVEDIWKVGVRAKTDEKGMVTRDELEESIKLVMEGERREEINKNAIRLKELALEAVDEGGSSDKNIHEFVSKILCNNYRAALC
ncbi:UDP-glycosyltransferase 74E2-like isoform X1 [Papaver somniferum]|uniref:UDP-glycosyltransferase 74E2-like isoform X1 n=2 Tax=Papaver somniferum TaxID=3469 RepID=UPI000E703F7A|nr:UDP-glycosyltransferase 74E2-like isoform X1 [Papaver somniferum]